RAAEPHPRIALFRRSEPRGDGGGPRDIAGDGEARSALGAGLACDGTEPRTHSVGCPMDPQQWRDVRMLFDELVELPLHARVERLATIDDVELNASVRSEEHTSELQSREK